MYEVWSSLSTPYRVMRPGPPSLSVTQYYSAIISHYITGNEYHSDSCEVRDHSHSLIL